MALSTQRDTDQVMAGFAAWLRDQDPDGAPEVVGCHRPAVGFSSETFLVDVRRGSARGDRRGQIGPERDGIERVVLKLPPPGPGGFPTYDFVLQARVQDAVAAAGVPAPAPTRVEDDVAWMGAPFLVMPAIPGHIIDEMPVRDHWLTRVEPALNTVVHGHYIDLLADVHRVDWRGLVDVVACRDNDAELEHWRRYLDWYGDGEVLVPSLVDALDWCDQHRPEAEAPPSLLWGDVRLGNVIFGEDRSPVAVLDWEMATIGSAEQDLAWTLTLEDIQAELFGRTVPGFLDRGTAIARYQARLGRPVRDLAWYEIFAMVRSTAVMTRIAHLYDRAGQPAFFPIADNPILAILHRRIAEADG